MKKEFKKIGEGYDKFAEEYHQTRISGKNFYNEMLEMPTTLVMLGKVKGKKILDLGCGIGRYAKILNEQGAIVSGIDVSEEELKIAKQINPTIDFKLGSAEKLPYNNNEFDIGLAALVIEHFENWDRLLDEVHRVLKKNGRFIFSMGNPVANSIKQKSKYGIVLKRNYFDEGKVVAHYGKDVYVNWYHKTYSTIIKTMNKHGFELIDYEDCKPLAKAAKSFPKEYAFASTLPYFCTWEWKKK